MHILLQGVDPSKLEGYRTALDLVSVSHLSVDSRKDQFARSIERLPALLDYCIQSGIKQNHPAKIDAIIAEREALMAPESEERANFSNAIDFFWILERLAKLSLKDMTKTEITEIYCAHPEAFQVWQYHFTGLAALLPITVKDIDLSQHISLGQKHSTHGLRRLSFLTPEQVQTLANIDTENLSYDMQDFTVAYHGISHPPILPFMKVEQTEEKHQLFATMEMDFRITLNAIKDWAQNQLPEGLVYLCSLKDETLHERIGMTFEHNETSVGEEQTAP